MSTTSDRSETVNATSPNTVDPAGPGMLENYKTWLAKAQSLVADDDVRALKLEPELIYYNVKTGISVVTPYRAQLTTDAPKVSWDEIESLTSLCQAMIYADDPPKQASVQTSPSDTETIADGHRLRRVLLNKLVVAADEGLVAESVVEDIRRGSGPRDMANDNIKLSAIFAQNPALAARMNVSAADIKAANDIGAEIIEIVKPTRGVVSVDAADVEPRDASAARDRIWTLVERTWERNVWRAGACIFGRDVEKHVPPLGRGHRARKTVEPPAPSPITTDETANKPRS